MPLFSLCSLALVTTLYAVVLSKINPPLDLTWLTVVIGTAICLAAVAIQAQSSPALWPGLEAACWAFMAGGAPIIAWQWGRSIAWRDAVIERIRTQYGNRAERMADESQTCAGERDGNPDRN